MTDIAILGPIGCDDEGERGKRGHRGATGSTGATGATGAAGIALLIAASQIGSNGTFPIVGNHPGFSAVVQSGTGLYTLTLVSPPANLNNLVVNIQIEGLIGGQSSFIILGGGMIEVHTFDAAGAPADRSFTIIAFDTTP